MPADLLLISLDFQPRVKNRIEEHFTHNYNYYFSVFHHNKKITAYMYVYGRATNSVDYNNSLSAIDL